MYKVAYKFVQFVSGIWL